MKEISTLKSRWSGVNPLSALDNPPFSLTQDGRFDLRYLPLREAYDTSGRSAERISFKRAHFKDYDLSGASMHWSISEHSVFENCIFEKTILTDFSEKGNLFSRCIFADTDLRLSQLGSKWKFAASENYESIYRDCFFRNIKTSKLQLDDPVFVNCSFYFKKLNDFDWGCAGFWDCTFEGTYNGMMFYGDYNYESLRVGKGRPAKSGLHKVSFRDAKLRWVGLRNQPALQDVEMPASGDAFLANVNSISKDIEKILGDCPDQETRKIMKNYLEIAFVDGPFTIFSRYDLLTFGPTENEYSKNWVFDYIKSKYLLE